MKQFLYRAWLLIGTFSVFPTANAQSLESITVDGTQRTYLVYKPANLEAQRPLLISCHGANQDAYYMKNEQMKMETVADTARFLIVFPNGIDKQWDISGDRDIHFIEALIDKMVEQHQVDRNCIYLSGFSMGGMLTYHAMNKIADKIAAFAPISGYPLYGSSANSSRPVPIMHTQGLADDICSPDGVPAVLAKWIARNNCDPTPTVIENYLGFSHAKMSIWGGGDEGTEVRLLELAGKGHWVSNDGLITGDEIWRFCKRFSLNKTTPNISITSPKSGTTSYCFAPQGEAAFPDIVFSANADDNNGTVTKVDFYDGDQLVGTDETSPYSVTLTGLTTGVHTLTAVATDNDGETSSTSVKVTLSSPSTLIISNSFNQAGCVPAGWTTYDGKETRVGYSNGYNLGCRILQFTGSPRGLNYGLYFRNVDGKPREGWAKFGLANGSATLSLTPGHYTLKYKICNWNKPNFEPVELDIEKRADGTSVAQQTYLPTINIGNVASNSFGQLEQQTFSFDITEQGEYVIALYTADVSYGDCILGQLILTADSYGTTDIREMRQDDKREITGNQVIYDLQGHRLNSSQLSKGLYIVNGKKTILH